MLNLKIFFETHALKKHVASKKGMPLSWIILRSAFYYHKEIVTISYSELQEIAGEMGINKVEYKHFLDSFTKCRSILYLPQIQPLKDIIILQPHCFINVLSYFFEVPQTAKQSTFNGIYTQSQLDQTITSENERNLQGVIKNLLCFLGLATEVHKDKIDGAKCRTAAGEEQPVLFIPLARNGPHLFDKTSSDSLFIKYTGDIPPDFQGMFGTELLSIPKLTIIGSTEVNVAKFMLVKQTSTFSFSLIFHSTHIEVLIENYKEIGDTLSMILRCCIRALMSFYCNV